MLLSFGAAEIAFRIIVPLASVFECRGAVQMVEALGQFKGFVTIIRSGIAGVINISFADNVYAANIINSFLETIKIHHHKIINIQASYISDGFSNDLRCVIVVFGIAEAELIDGIYFSLNSHIRN